MPEAENAGEKGRVSSRPASDSVPENNPLAGAGIWLGVFGLKRGVGVVGVGPDANGRDGV